MGRDFARHGDQAEPPTRTRNLPGGHLPEFSTGWRYQQKHTPRHRTLLSALRRVSHCESPRL
jgi:hypothetical protein